MSIIELFFGGMAILIMSIPFGVLFFYLYYWLFE